MLKIFVTSIGMKSTTFHLKLIPVARQQLFYSKLLTIDKRTLLLTQCLFINLRITFYLMTDIKIRNCPRPQVEEWRLHGQTIDTNFCGLNFPTFILQFRENPRIITIKNLVRKPSNSINNIKLYS